MIINSQMIDCVTELVNIGAGKAANAMNQLLSSHIKLTIPWVDFNNCGQSEEFKAVTGVQMRFSGTPEGYAQMFFKNADIPNMMQGLLGFDTDSEIDETLKVSALSEIGNIVINAIVGSICNISQSQVVYDVPEIIESNSSDNLSTGMDNSVIRIGTAFVFEKFGVSAVLQLFIYDSSFLSRVQI